MFQKNDVSVSSMRNLVNLKGTFRKSISAWSIPEFTGSGFKYDSGIRFRFWSVLIKVLLSVPVLENSVLRFSRFYLFDQKVPFFKKNWQYFCYLFFCQINYYWPNTSVFGVFNTIFPLNFSKSIQGVFFSVKFAKNAVSVTRGSEIRFRFLDGFQFR